MSPDRHTGTPAHRAVVLLVPERLGMTLEGVRREAWPYEGVRYDKQVWAVLASEWRARGH
ncbi:hypothetical protein ACFVY9_13735 [Streptomyces sp. NPDC059544]|uniref:hypothetical protein n=1 Tax=Streptomyces sp. NPDC059544 TaxID=3346861 RepID=UPI0036BACAF5